MKILNGINDGMVTQRDTATNECDILLSLECEGEPAAKYDGKAVSLTREGDNWRLTASVITFKSGAIATFVSTTCAYPGISTDIQLYGTGGTIEADADILKRWRLKDSEDEDEEEEEMLEKYGGGNRIAEKKDPMLVTGHASMVENIVDAVLDHKDPQILPLEAIKSVRIVNAVYESAKTGKTIYFD